MKPPFVRNPYNYDVDEASDDAALICEDASLTIQSEAEDADINTIVKRFGLTGQLPTDVRMPVSGDFTGISDYHTAVNTVKAAELAFMEMPADVRKRFNHDPANLIAFMEDPSNRDEAVKLGLVVPAPVPAAAAPVAPSASPPPGAGT